MPMKTLFMGTPVFAEECLRAMLQAGIDVCGIFSQPDKPIGRKMILTPPPVKVLAESAGIPVFQPEKLRDGTALKIIEELAPELIVVVAYGRILPEAILDYPSMGCVNVHASLLPKYRGAAPIQWSIVRGEKETGVTTMYMAPELDAGDMILSEKTTIDENETAGELHDRLMTIGARALLETLTLIRDGRAKGTPQNAEEATFAPILKREDGQIDFTQPVREVHDFIRGFTPWPGAVYNGLRIWKARIDGACAPGVPGTVVDVNGVLCGDGGILRLLEVQPAGGRRMNIFDYIRGHTLF